MCPLLHPTKSIALIFSFLLLAVALHATHIVGGEISYLHLGNDQYEVTLKVYRDCGPANVNLTGFDEIAAVGVYTQGFLFTQLDLFLSEAIVSDLPVNLDNPCFTLPPDLCVEEAVYTGVVSMPGNATGYDLVYQRCCRNPSIINIQFPQDSGATFYTHVPGFNELPVGDNSSPVFDNFPPVALCTGVEFVFDHGATDPDGDLLVYEFCTPKLGGDPFAPQPIPPSPPPYVDITWAAAYSESYPIASNPAFTLDPTTGLLVGTPSAPGQYVVGICVSEYRNGELLSTSNRDFQFNVVVCDPNIIAAIPSQTQFCDGLTFEFGNNSVNSSFYFWDFGDPGNPDDTSELAEPTYTFSSFGEYTVMLVANPGWPCADTAFIDYNIQPILDPVVVNSGSSCEGNSPLFDFTASGQIDEPNAVYLWNFGPGAIPLSSNLQSPQNVFLGDAGGQFEVQLSVTANGCTEVTTYELELPPSPLAIIEEQDLYCNGFTYTFGNNSTNADSYFWNFGVAGVNDDNSTDFEPTYSFPGIGDYVITLIANADMACPDTAYATFAITTLLDPWFDAPSPQCLVGNNFSFEAQGTEASNPSFFWDFGDLAEPSTSTEENPQGITYPAAGTYEVTLIITENDCERSFTDEIEVIPNPIAGFELAGAIGCIPLVVSFQDTSFAASGMTYLWDFGDGSSSTLPDPVHVYTESGSYDISLQITTTAGCITTTTAFLEDAIIVHPDPIAAFTVDPDTVSVLSPLVQFTDLSSGGVECWYEFGDGGSSDEWNPSYAYTDGGRFAVIQTITNEFGCVDSAVAVVIVEGFVFYVPNAFTPNEDGTNDVFIPVTFGIKDYHFQIYNRWGELIFESYDRTEAWDGKRSENAEISQDGVYIWKARIEDNFSIPHEYVGHFTLFR
jgi:gliding motility-associated-like protein